MTALGLGSTSAALGIMPLLAMQRVSPATEVEVVSPELLEPRLLWTALPFSNKPDCETHDEEGEGLGVYAAVLRYRDHGLPVVEVLARHAGK